MHRASSPEGVGSASPGTVERGPRGARGGHRPAEFPPGENLKLNVNGNDFAANSAASGQIESAMGEIEGIINVSVEVL